MSKRATIAAGVVLAAVLVSVALRLLDGGEPADTAVETADSKIFYDRFWIDVLPRTETDEFHVLATLSDEGIGLFDHRSMWRGDWELFRYEPRGEGKIELLFPQTRKRENATYKAWKCDDGNFDFCLELRGASHGAKRYFSRKGWEIEAGSLASPDDLRAAAATLLAAER